MSYRDFSVNYCKVGTCEQYPTWPSDPDIAGLGVIIAFCATSLATLFAIIIGYFCGCIRDGPNDSLLNALDYRIIQYATRHTYKPHQNEGSPWQDALERFILSLSDQQLATGIAILSIGYIHHCSLSSYHFIIIVTLAWFSSTTHLSTLSVLQHHLNKYPVLKYTRVIGMIILYVMLMFGLVAQYAEHPFNVSVQCRLAHLSFAGKRRIFLFVAINLFVFLTINYILKLSILLPPRWQISSSKNMDSRGRKTHCIVKIKYFDTSNFPPTVRKTLQLFIVVHYVFLEFIESFLCEICWMLFRNIYGIRQIFWARQCVGTLIILVPEDAETTLSFGQLLALFLLIIPLLAAFEAFEARNLQRRRETNANAATQFGSPNGCQSQDVGISVISAVCHGEAHPAEDIITDLACPMDNTDSQSIHRSTNGSSEQTYRLPSQIDIPRFVELIFAVVILYTLATLTVVAYYIGWAIAGNEIRVIVGIVMGGVLLIMTLVSYAFKCWDWFSNN